MSVLSPSIEKNIWRREMKQIPLQKALIWLHLRRKVCQLLLQPQRKKNHFAARWSHRGRLMQSLNKHGLVHSKERRNGGLDWNEITAVWEACDLGLCLTPYPHSWELRELCGGYSLFSTGAVLSTYPGLQKAHSTSGEAQVFYPSFRNRWRELLHVTKHSWVAQQLWQSMAHSSEWWHGEVVAEVQKAAQASAQVGYSLMWLHCFQSRAPAWAFLHNFTRGETPWDMATTCKASPQALGSSCLAKRALPLPVCTVPAPWASCQCHQVCKKQGHNDIIFSSFKKGGYFMGSLSERD